MAYYCFTLSGLNSSGYYYYQWVSIKNVTFHTHCVFMFLYESQGQQRLFRYAALRDRFL
jgi:hypothetical protein